MRRIICLVAIFAMLFPNSAFAQEQPKKAQFCRTIDGKKTCREIPQNNGEPQKENRPVFPSVSGANRMNPDTQVLYLVTDARYPEYLVQILQDRARAVLGKSLTVVVNAPIGERVSYETVTFELRRELVEWEYVDNVLSEVARRTINIGGTAGVLVDEGMDKVGLSGRWIREYYHNPYSLKYGNPELEHPITNSGFADMRVVVKRDRHPSVDVRSVELVGKRTTCWKPEKIRGSYPNFDGELESWMFQIALDESSLESWITGNPPQFDPVSGRSRKAVDNGNSGKCDWRR